MWDIEKRSPGGVAACCNPLLQCSAIMNGVVNKGEIAP